MPGQCACLPHGRWFPVPGSRTWLYESSFQQLCTAWISAGLVWSAAQWRLCNSLTWLQTYKKKNLENYGVIFHLPVGEDYNILDNLHEQTCGPRFQLNSRCKIFLIILQIDKEAEKNSKNANMPGKFTKTVVVWWFPGVRSRNRAKNLCAWEISNIILSITWWYSEDMVEEAFEKQNRWSVLHHC